MKPIESLKARLSNDKLLVQNEKGFLSTVGFEWNPAATDKEIAEFETVLHHQLPAEFKEFLKISNGATFFKDLDYGQWGFHILSLAELSEIQSKVTTWGYDLKPEWLPFVTCLGDCDILLMFLVLNRTQALCPKIIPTDEGSRIVVSQELNTPSIVWALGGHRFENLLLKGEVSTICSDNVSKQMMADVRKVFSRYCKKVDGYYVSPGVFLLSNTRLITISAAENTAVDFCLPEKNR